MHLSVACAVINDAGALLLARRGDLKLWNLPSGRLDSGEYLDSAAAREVQEETGIVAHIDRAVGIYYAPARRSLMTVFAGLPLRGELRPDGFESRAVRYFPPDALPDDLLYPIMSMDALAGTRHLPRVLELSPAETRRMALKLRLRYVENLLRGKPEPKRVSFDVQAVGVVWDETHRRLLTLRRKRTEALPRVVCTGERPPWDELADAILRETGAAVSLRWVGVWQDVERDRVEFVFAATTTESHDLPEGAEWSLARNIALPAREMRYVHLVKPSYARDRVWLLGREKTIDSGDTIALD